MFTHRLQRNRSKECTASQYGERCHAEGLVDRQLFELAKSENPAEKECARKIHQVALDMREVDYTKRISLDEAIERLVTEYRKLADIKKQQAIYQQDVSDKNKMPEQQQKVQQEMQEYAVQPEHVQQQVKKQYIQKLEKEPERNKTQLPRK